jgi:uncharacterized Zn-binding protein involved in type VI secretion
MTALCRKGDTLTTGHLCDTTTVLDTPSQSTVYADGKLVARITDKTVSHLIRVGDACVPHIETVKQGSPDVYVAGLKVARVNDSVDSGKLTTGSSTIFVNGSTGTTTQSDVLTESSVLF